MKLLEDIKSRRLLYLKGLLFLFLGVFASALMLLENQNLRTARPPADRDLGLLPLLLFPLLRPGTLRGPESEIRGSVGYCHPPPPHQKVKLEGTLSEVATTIMIAFPSVGTGEITYSWTRTSSSRLGWASRRQEFTAVRMTAPPAPTGCPCSTCGPGFCINSRCRTRSRVPEVCAGGAPRSQAFAHHKPGEVHTQNGLI